MKRLSFLFLLTAALFSPRVDVVHAQPQVTRLVAWGNRLDLASTLTGQAGSALISPVGLTLVRFTAFTTTAGLTCATAPVLSIRDATASVNLSSLTFTNTLSGFDSGVIAVTVPAGDTIIPSYTTGGSGCGTNASGVTFTALFQ